MKIILDYQFRVYNPDISILGINYFSCALKVIL